MSRPAPSRHNRQTDVKPFSTALPSAEKLSLLRLLLSHLREARNFKRLAIAAMCAAGLAGGILVPVRASEARETRPQPGLTYTNITVASEPWSIHVLKIDRSRQDLAFFSAHARDKVLAVSLLAEQ